MASYSVKYVTSFSPSLRDRTTLSMRCLVHLQGPWLFISARDLEQTVIREEVVLQMCRQWSL